MLDPDALSELSRAELQSLAKQHGIKANMKVIVEKKMVDVC